jgi:radical SAM superfamily enzyme YgiQ (UPF0313 family)
MKILLTTLNSKYIHSNLALKYLYAACAERGSRLELKEYTINNSDDYIYGELLRGAYDVICFSCYIWNIEKTLRLIESLRKADPGVKLVLGGPEVTWRSIEIMKKHKEIDFVLAGEGEENLPKLIDALASNAEPRGFYNIPGLHYRSEGKIYVNPKATPVKFNNIAFPFLNLIPEEDKIIYYESARGCPFSCSYCISAIERGIRPLDIDRVKSDLSYFIYKGVKQVKFVDRTFNYDDARAVEIISYLIESDRGITNFHFELCGDLISEKLLSILSCAREGLFQFEIGVQSSNERTLKAINRNCNLQVLSDNIKTIVGMGNIHLHLDLIAGLPYEDYDSFTNSFNFVYNLKPHMLQLGFLKLLPGTPIRDDILKYDYSYRSTAPYEVISNKFMSAKEFVKLKMVEMVLNLYYNRRGFERSLNYLAFEVYKNPFAVYEDIADFFYGGGFQHRSHNKEDLYRILYSFGKLMDESGKVTCDKLGSTLEQDMDGFLNPEAIRKFNKRGWRLQDE